MTKNIELTDYEKELLESARGKKVFCNIVSVSKSGMSRKMRFYIIENDDLRNITHLISEIAGYKMDNDYNLKVSGCGMNMIFSVLSNFNYAMAQLDTGKTLTELLKTKECGERIYDNYFIDANYYGQM